MSTGKGLWYAVVMCCGLCSPFVLQGQDDTSEDLRIRGMTYYLLGDIPLFTVRFESENYVNRILLQESSDLETWYDLNLPESFRTIDDSTLYWEWSAFARYFYRGILVYPEIQTVFQDIELDSGVISADIPFVAVDQAYSEWLLDVTATSSNQMTVPDENIVLTRTQTNWLMTILPTVEGTDPAVITVTVTAPDGIFVQSAFTVSSLGGTGFALEPEAFAERVVGYQFTGLGYEFASEVRFDLNGEPGNWSYERSGLHTGLLVFTYDKDGNDPANYREEYLFSFETKHAGSYQFSKIEGNLVQTSSSGTFDLDLFSEIGATVALSFREFADKVIGQSFFIPGYVFTSDTRFRYNAVVPEPGNWTYQKTGDTTATVILTKDIYDNDPAVYREEIELTYATRTTGSYKNDEYRDGVLRSTARGFFDLR